MSKETKKGSTSLAERPVPKNYVPRLKKLYEEKIVPELKQKLGRENVFSLPRLEKIVVNMGVGDALNDGKALEAAVEDLKQITGQQPRITRARKSEAGFKLRAGQAIGCMVTLRGDKMWEFFDRLVSLAIPRVKDFRGLNRNSFDGRGNYNFGIGEQSIFPEVSYDQVYKFRGMDVAIQTSARNDDEARVLLELLGFPLKKN